MEGLNFQKVLCYTLFMCFALVHLSVGNENSWPKQKQSKTTKLLRPNGGTIDIDNPQGGFYEGSADRESSGNGPLDSDDEDDMEMSGSHGHDVSHVGLTSCQRQRLLAARIPGEHQPQCNALGDYESVQCGSGYCWCVNSEGMEVANSRQWRMQPDCRNLDRKQVVIAPPDMSPPKKSRDPIDDTGGSRDQSSDIVGNGDYRSDEDRSSSRHQIFDHPGILAGIIGGAVFGLLCAVLLVMFIVYRMRKSDDAAYPMKMSPPAMGYMRTPQVFS